VEGDQPVSCLCSAAGDYPSSRWKTRRNEVTSLIPARICPAAPALEQAPHRFHPLQLLVFPRGDAEGLAGPAVEGAHAHVAVPAGGGALAPESPGAARRQPLCGVQFHLMRFD